MRRKVTPNSKWLFLLAINACFGIVGCSTTAAEKPAHFYTSTPGDDEKTVSVFTAVDTRLRLEPGLLRDLDGPMEVHIANGVESPDGQIRFNVRITVVASVVDKHIAPIDRTLAEFSTVCSPTDPQPCVDAILKKTKAARAVLVHVLANAPREFVRKPT
jgi:hypothetical protein